MAVTTVTDLKARLSAWLDTVRAGNEVVVTDHGHPVARLVPIDPTLSGSRLAALARAGLIRPASGRLPENFWSAPRPAVPGGAAARAVIEDRDVR